MLGCFFFLVWSERLAQSHDNQIRPPLTAGLHIIGLDAGGGWLWLTAESITFTLGPQLGDPPKGIIHPK